ncbi:hypothetical protein CK203_061454 [Vitis vinifera]|uniref:Uncharacterized protein n=1 Tax=Vitis vinifera TaxID=29760 RepID=A0A438FKL6_VITVI|nr:hypothetical protein CK203_061454 [Vitis vinifera]
MEERERPSERVCERDGEESWFQGANGDSEGQLQSGGRERSFGIESKTLWSRQRRRRAGTQIFIVERKGDVSSWIKLGSASLGPLIEGLIGKRRGSVSLFPEAEEQKGLGPLGGGAAEMESIPGGQARQEDKDKFWIPMLGKSFAEVVKQNAAPEKRWLG